MIEKDNDFVKKNSNSKFCTHQGPSNHYVLAQRVMPLLSIVFVKNSNHESKVEVDPIIA